MSFTYLGKVVFVLALPEGVAVEIGRLIGQLGDDGVFHFIWDGRQKDAFMSGIKKRKLSG